MTPLTVHEARSLRNAALSAPDVFIERLRLQNEWHRVYSRKPAELHLLGVLPKASFDTGPRRERTQMSRCRMAAADAITLGTSSSVAV